MPKPDVSTPLEQGLEFALVEQDAGPIAALSQGLEHMAGEMTRHVANWTLQQADHFGLTQHRPLQGLLDMCRQQSIRQERSSQRRRPHNSSLMPRWTPVLASLHVGPRAVDAHTAQSGSENSLSLTLPPPRHGAMPLGELAMAKDEVKARLAPIPVFTVANPKNEFVLVAGENNTQLGFFFFRREDAEAIVEKIREESPRLARDSKILRVTMDNVYEVFTTPREQTGLQGIHFRFMPDMRQVVHALNLYREAGVPTRSFTGVPVFQAEGLTVTAQDTQYVPLFLSKEDLDVAVQSAYKQRNQAQIQVYRDKAAKYEEDYNQVAVQAQSATGREKAALEARAQKAKTKLDAAKEKADAVEKAPLPKVEVGSFEEVMQRMTDSTGPDLASWSQVMFVAPGLLHQAVQKDS